MTAMPARRRWPWVLLFVLLALAALAWWFPARWAWRLVRHDYPAVHVDTVGGSIWQGHAGGLVVGGQHLGTLRWTLGRAAVLGHVHGRLDLHGAGVMANGHIARTADGAIVVRDAHFQVPMERLKVLWPTGMRLEGELQGDVARAHLVQGWPTRLEAKVRWHAAAAVTRGREVALGEWLSHWQASGGTVVTADLSDDGSGPVRLAGTFTATPLGWRLAALLTPRRDSAGLRQWLQRLGKPAPGGGVRVERHGGLMTGNAWQ